MLSAHFVCTGRLPLSASNLCQSVHSTAGVVRTETSWFSVRASITSTGSWLIVARQSLDHKRRRIMLWIASKILPVQEAAYAR